ncbi:MAG: DUF4142 domain-containing protein [Reyranella sp.]|nr:DUF4142 domain-containing protein [Reyranella sp.]
MTTTRRSLLAVLAAAPVLPAALAHAQDALPDARFVGFAQAVNDFEIGSGNMAMQRSTNENIRGYASRAIAEATENASAL